jgi:hypothetical protein
MLYTIAVGLVILAAGELKQEGSFEKPSAKQAN